MSHIKQIVTDLQNGTRKPDKIIIFADGGFKVDIPDVIVIQSTHPFPVTARLYASTFADTDYVFLLDCDQTVELETIANMEMCSKMYPKAVLGFEGNTLRDIPQPYTGGITVNKTDKFIPTDILIRSWFVPRQVIPMGIILYGMGGISCKYTDDILICMANRLMLGNINYVIPHLPNMGLKELGDEGIGQCLSSQHYQTRNNTCRYLLDIKDRL